MKKLLLFILLIITSIVYKSNAQFGIDGVSYKLKYNTDSCWYDFYLVVNAGSAITEAERHQLNAQISIVTPTGTTLSIQRGYMPLINNSVPETGEHLQNFWSINSHIVNPISAPGKDFWGIYPNFTAGNALYNELFQGDEVKLFSLISSSLTNCGKDVRIYINGIDPTSADPGMGGSDFTNAFYIQSQSNPVYNNNAQQIYPPIPFIDPDPVIGCSNGIEIDLTTTTSGCQFPLTYAWTGPNGYTSTSEDVAIFPATTINEGAYKVIVKDSIGCIDSLEVVAFMKPQAGPDQVVCAGTSAMVSGTSPTTGIWSSLNTNPSGATIIPGVNGNASIAFSHTSSGVYKFKYATPLCSDTINITVNARPSAILGAPAICANLTTTLSSNQTGTWVSNNTSVATTTAGGFVTGISQGNVTFIFTNTNTGCQNTTPALVVNPEPTVTINTDTICIGNTASLTPTSGGTWTSTTASIATVTNLGVATGISAGVTKLVFRETLSPNCVSDTIILSVLAKPMTTLTGPNPICIGATTTFTPSFGGTWSSLDPTIATITSSGLVTGVLAGATRFVYTQINTGCTSNPSTPITVQAKPTVAGVPSTPRCIGATIQLSPSSGGTWVSNNTSVATINATTGLVTAVGLGTVNFTFTTTTGCYNTTSNLVVSPKPTVSSAMQSICVGSTTTISPNPASGTGTWTNLTPTKIVRSGATVMGVAAGEGRLLFTETATTCVSDTLKITVKPRPVITLIGSDSICVGTTTSFIPSTGGTWSSANNAIATVNNTGKVTGVTPGYTTFTYTNTSTACVSDLSPTITILPNAAVSITGPDKICIGNTTSLSPTSGGTWTSSNSAVASVNNAGLVTGISPGNAIFVFTDAFSGCVSYATSPVTVSTKVLTTIADNTLCINQATSVSPGSGGTWISSNNAVATVTNTGIVTAISAGSVSFTFTSNSPTCLSDPITANVIAKPTVAFTGPDTLCIGDTSSLSASPLSGTWASATPSVATVTASGSITAVAQGTATFIYTDTDGCPSDASAPLTVNARPTIGVPVAPQICIGSNTTISPSTGGTWVSSDPTIATITNGGIITGIKSGLAKFIFTDTIGCKSQESQPLTVLPHSTITITGPSTIKVGETTTFTANTVGTWFSSNPSVATVNSSGIVTGINQGTVGIQFVSALGCISNIIFIEVKGYTYSISGFCFTDLNGNNIFDDNIDFPLPNVNINISNDSVTYYTNVNGYFDIPVDSGEVVMNNTIHFGNWVNDTIIRNLSIINPRNYVFVGFVPSTNGSNATGLAAASSSKAKCKSFANLYAQAFNASSQLADGYLIVAYDPSTYVNASSPLPSGGQGNYLVWNFSDLPPGRTFSPDIEYWVPDALGLNDSLHFTVYMVDISTGDTLSTFALAQAIECNGNINLDRARTWPDRAGDDNYTLVGEQISYNITFSNKGNGPASAATIACAIDKNLDLASLKIQKSSHNFEVTSMNGTLTFYADSIALDASTRDGNSDVYVSFTLDQNPGLADKTLLYLDAHLSLDNGFTDKSNTLINTIVGILPCDFINDDITKVGNSMSVTTAGTSHIWYDCTTGQQIANGTTFKPTNNGKFYCVIEGPSCKHQTDCFDFIYTSTYERDVIPVNVYPNPVQDLLYIDCPANTIYTVVEDMMGKEILHTHDRQISLRDLTSGMYMIKIKINGQDVVKRIVKL
jgi:uncharacterized protein YjdB